MIPKRKIVFLTGTRADYGKLKPLIQTVESLDDFEAHIFVTGMHMLPAYGVTVSEIIKNGFQNIYLYNNKAFGTGMDINLANTISGFTCYVKDLEPDLIVVHGDRPEALAGAIVGSFNNILVAHVEGGEVSGTIDELIRHSITKLSHAHFVTNENAGKRLLQMGESRETIFELGSPELDVMFSDDLPHVDEAKKHYEVHFEKYAILMYHPVTTELSQLSDNIRIVIDAVIESDVNYLAIMPNNDSGSEIIIKEYERLIGNRRIAIFSSIRFEYYLAFLKCSQFIIGNSSSGVRESSAFGIPSVNIGSRQTRRNKCEQVLAVNEDKTKILKAINSVVNGGFTCKPEVYFGDGKSAYRFEQILKGSTLWSINLQKEFVDQDLVPSQ